MTAAGSPGVNRSMRKTKMATTASTGMMAMRRRAMKSIIVCGLPYLTASIPTLRRLPAEGRDEDQFHFFSMFHITGTGALSQPEMLERMAPGPYHWPIQPYWAVCKARA